MIPLYYGTIQGGKLHLTRNEKGLFRAYLDTLEGKEVQVAVEERKDQRTLNQNAYLWGVVYKLICDYTGDEPESFHEWAKDKFLGKKTVVIRGEERQVTRSTTELTKDEFFDVYVVVTSFSLAPIGTCGVAPRIVSSGSRLPVHEESPPGPLAALFSIG